MPDKSFQELYPEETQHCYGCGVRNEHGHRIQSFWARRNLRLASQPGGPEMLLPWISIWPRIRPHAVS